MNTLVGYDGSESAQRALELAMRLAGAGHVTVAHVAATLADEAEQDEVLAEAITRGEANGQTLLTLRRQGVLARELIDAAREIRAELIVVGSRGRGAISSAVLGSVSSAVAAGAASPVLVVPPEGRLTGRCIIAAVDGSEDSAEAARVAAVLSGRLEVPLLLAHAYVVRPIPGASVVPGAREELAQSERERAQRLLVEAAEDQEIEQEATRLVTGPSEVAAILSLADEKEAWMVVVGSRGRGAVKSAVLGSFSSAVAAQSSSPVLVVPTGAKQAFAA